VQPDEAIMFTILTSGGILLQENAKIQETIIMTVQITVQLSDEPFLKQKNKM
jgi:hypothetical protein